MAYIQWFDTLSKNDALLVGGKYASLSEMISTLKKGVEGVIREKN